MKINDKFLWKEEGMSVKKKVGKLVAKGMKDTLDIVLLSEANTTSCVIFYQPKAPKELMKYRRKK